MNDQKKVPSRNRNRLGRDEKGTVLVLIAIILVVLLGMVALAVDLGMLFTAKTESQRVADSSALAGAGWLLTFPQDEAGARQEAIQYAAKHQVRGQTSTVLEEDVDVLLNETKVRVRVHNIAARGSAIPTFFARILGFNQMNVATVAAAQAYPALGVECILPLALPDRWCEEPKENGVCPAGAWPDPIEPDRYGDDPDDWYEPWWDGESDQPNESFTGYAANDAGYEILIKPGNPRQAPHPGWFFPFRIPGTQGGADYREAICECMGEGVEWGEEMTVETEPGNMIGPTKQGFSCLIDKDPTATWNPNANGGQGCVTSGLSDMQCRSSERIRPMVMFHPGDPPDPGMKPFKVTNYVGVFVEEVQGNDIWVRFVRYMGVDPSNLATTDQVPPMVETIRLVE